MWTSWIEHILNEIMAVMADGRRCYQTSEIADGTYEVRGERSPEMTERICGIGKFVRKNPERELRFIDYFREIFTGCNWEKVYPLTEAELYRVVTAFMGRE